MEAYRTRLNLKREAKFSFQLSSVSSYVYPVLRNPAEMPLIVAARE